MPMFTKVVTSSSVQPFSICSPGPFRALDRGERRSSKGKNWLEVKGRTLRKRLASLPRLRSGQLEKIKATLTSHMEFHRYPMDVQTLRLQIAGCKNKENALNLRQMPKHSYDDSQVKYEWSSVKLREKDMTEFYVDKESLRAESTIFITGTGTGMFLARHHI
ncbi:hypothetical protein P5673_005570 [Acropora cervicornis]|uniref:Uncharacterized protein n=1 Tax=Acropora cervicornis TaxID=6130 RepID=A0AAD9VD82_ACRCE|nr:hypothetical protein P5673_005570 [Acropora cervicornis]